MYLFCAEKGNTALASLIPMSRAHSMHGHATTLELDEMRGKAEGGVERDTEVQSDFTNVGR